MARVTLSGLISDIRGKLNGSVFKQSNAGLILQNKPAGGGQGFNLVGAPKNLQSVSGQSAMQSNQIVKNQWDAMTENQRQLWDAIVASQPRKQKNNIALFLTGLQYFVQVNVVRVMLGNNILITPLAGSTLPERLEVISIVSSSGLLVTFNRPVVSGEIVILKLSGPVRNTINNVGSRLRLFPASGLTPFTNVTIKTDYEAQFGVITAPGELIFVSVSVQNSASGLRSIETPLRILVV